MKPGIYKAKPLENALCASATKGTEFVAIVFEVVDGPERGERIRADLYVTDKTSDRATRALRMLGWAGGVDSSMRLTGLVNAVPIGVIEETKNNGRVEPKVDWVGESPFGGIDDKLRLTPENARNFVLALRRNAGIAPKNGARPAAPPAREPGDDMHEEPF